MIPKHPDEAQAMLQQSVARFLEQEYTFAQRQRMRDAEPGSGHDQWRRFAEMGWTGIPFPEEVGGFGGEPMDVAIVMHQFGRALVTEPYVGNVILAGDLVCRLGSVEQKARWLAPMIAGRCRLAFAFAERQSRYRLEDCGTRAESCDGGFRISGTKIVVPGGAEARVFIVLARTAGARTDSDGLSLFAVDCAAAGVKVTRTPTIDGQGACELALDSALVGSDALIGSLNGAYPFVARTLDYACAMVCAEAIGILEVLLDDTIAYVKERRQFGRALGQNQVLQHRLVDMHIQYREAEGLVQNAIASLMADDPVQRQRAVSAAKIQVGNALRLVGQEAVQMHGGIGTTDELHISHYFKRATAINLQFGDVGSHTARLGALLGSDKLDAAAHVPLVALTGQEQDFAEAVREFIASHLPPALASKVANEQILSREEYIGWQQTLARKGWLGYMWPREYGGPGWTPRQKFIFETICTDMDCPWIVPFGLRMVAPVLQRFGAPWQKERFLPSILHATEWWCQGYSEPNAGSDLASLTTRAERSGDRYVLNGQKIWTSYAHYADWMFCLVRTSRELRPQDGISFLLIDMRSPGIEVRPIIAMDGSHSYNSVFFTNVEVPVRNLVGEEGRGWSCAKYLLTHERLETAALGGCQRSMCRLRSVVFARIDGAQPLADDPLFLARVVEAEVRLMALEARVLGFLQQEEGEHLGAEVSELKVRGTELHQGIHELIMEAAGYQALPYQRDFVLGKTKEVAVGPQFAGTAAARYFNRRSISILGGSNEIQKNIVAKAVLGL
jgi:alkylation response protein AidB-like acyl-CoA dehydrogenase